jgi:hypothetical protein
MFGIEVTLASGQKAVGVIFPDGQVYVHEPIADSYGSVSDLLVAEKISDFHVLGPVVPIEVARRKATEGYLASIEQIGKVRKQVEEDYKGNIAALDEYTKYTPSCTDDSTSYFDESTNTAITS